MSLDDAYGKALESMAQIDPLAVASLTGVAFDGAAFLVPLLNRSYALELPTCRTSEVETGASVPRIFAILLMHYLTHADGAAVSGSWITYRQLPGARLFEQKFANLVSRPMIKCFGSDVEGFREAALSIGGQEMECRGDAAFSFKALPKVPIASIFYNGEEGIPPSINVMFDGSASHYLPTDDLVVLASFMSSSLRGYKDRKKV